ncbi:hypothetical protein J4440_00425 [Candidatus Woesearchaeota archaeon]|nr:hypothetical protein [Candidatus Woesearchaeota archaeon]
MRITKGSAVKVIIHVLFLYNIISVGVVCLRNFTLYFLEYLEKNSDNTYKY